MSRFSRVVVATTALLLTCGLADAQWLKLKTPNIPRTADGKPDLKAPAPRMSGKPDLSGYGDSTRIGTRTTSSSI